MADKTTKATTRKKTDVSEDKARPLSDKESETAVGGCGEPPYTPSDDTWYEPGGMV